MVAGTLFVLKTGNSINQNSINSIDISDLESYVNSEEFLRDEDAVIETESEESEPAPQASDVTDSELHDREPAAGRDAFAFRISSRKGWRRHPISGRVRYHSGTDYAAPCGTPISSRQAGNVSYAGWMGGYGRTVVVNYGSCSALYGHMSRTTVGVGHSVSPGSQLGLVGRTGYATGCHLHYEDCTPSKHNRLSGRANGRGYPTIQPQQTSSPFWDWFFGRTAQ